MEITKSFSVKGRVQQVGFRWFVRQKAAQFSIKGWVRNNSDLSVEGTAKGEPKNLADFFAAIAEGNALAKVDEIKTSESEEPVKDFFEIRF